MTRRTQKKPVMEIDDWTAPTIIAALHNAGITLSALANVYGLKSSSALSHTFVRSYPLNEKRIANAIGLHPMVIWPSRYNADGSVKPRGFRAVQFNAIEQARNSKEAAASGKMLKAI